MNEEKGFLYIVGHTCNRGDEQLNLAVSKTRARVAARVLSELGAPSENMEIIGKGEADPIASNETREGRRKNRRVEFYLK